MRLLLYTALAPYPVQCTHVHLRSRTLGCQSLDGSRWKLRRRNGLGFMTINLLEQCVGTCDRGPRRRRGAQALWNSANTQPGTGGGC